MSKDDKCSNNWRSTWEDARHQAKRIAVRVPGMLLKLGGVLAIIVGLLTIALANMDIDPRESIIGGMMATCIGLLTLYFRIKIAKRAKRP